MSRIITLSDFFTNVPEIVNVTLFEYSTDPDFSFLFFLLRLYDSITETLLLNSIIGLIKKKGSSIEILTYCYFMEHLWLKSGNSPRKLRSRSNSFRGKSHRNAAAQVSQWGFSGRTPSPAIIVVSHCKRIIFQKRTERFKPFITIIREVFSKFHHT